MRFLSILIILLSSLAVSGQTVDEKIEALMIEVSDIKEKMAIPETVEEDNHHGDGHHHGLSQSASKVYFSSSKLSIGGYGEVAIQNIQGESGDTADALRFVPYFGYRFTDNIILNAEVEVEHADEIFLEFAYLDFLMNEGFNIRAGLVLIPFGITNLHHEPTLFPSVNRPELERNIIPTTWRENGALIYGKWSGFSYSLGVVNSFDAANFSDSSWIRGGRQKGSKAKSDNWSGTARIVWENVSGLRLGTSFYTGKSSQETDTLGDATVTLWEGHLIYQLRALKLKALYVQGKLTDSDKVSTVTGKTVGEEAQGYYVEGQYNFWPHLKPESSAEMNLFVRHEDYDTHSKVAASLTEDETLDKKRTVVGVTFLPTSQVILKANWQFRSNKQADEADFLEFGLGYIF